MQGRTNLEALNALFALKRVMAYDRLPEKAERYAVKVRERWGPTLWLLQSRGRQ